MIMDIAIFLIVLISAVFYAHKGFAMSVISTLQWIGCIVLGLFFCDDIKGLLMNSPIGKGMESGIAESISTAASENEVAKSIPEIFRSWQEEATDLMSDKLAESITGIILAVASFIAVILIVKIALFIAFHLLSKEYVQGPVAWLDGLAGFVLGTVLGSLYVLIGLAILVLLMNILPEGWSEALLESLDSSYFAGTLYDNNPLLDLLNNII